MGEAAVNLGFLAATTLAIGRDVYGRLPESARTSSKRLRGEPTVTLPMEDACDPAALPPTRGRASLPPPVRKAVKQCCEELLEQKWVEEGVTGTVPAVATSQRVTCVNDIGQGTTATTRVGNKILMKYLLIEGIAYLGTNTDSDVYRLIVVMDHECFGAACTWAQYTQGTAVATSVYALPSMETVGSGKRFTTLVDKQIPVNAVAAPAASPQHYVPFSIRIPLAASAHYSGNAGTVSDLVRNSICVIETSAGGRVTSNWVARLTFLDG